MPTWFVISFPFDSILTYIIFSDCRQGRHVGEQAGVAGTGRTRLDQARPAINGLYLHGSWSALFPCDFLFRIVCQPYCPGLFLTPFFFFAFAFPHPCRYTPVYLVVSPASYIVPRLVWCGWIWDVHNRKEQTISIDCFLLAYLEYLPWTNYLRMVQLITMIAYNLPSISVYRDMKEY